MQLPVLQSCYLVNILDADAVASMTVAYLMNILDVDTVASSIVLENNLLKEHESPLVLCMLPDLQHTLPLGAPI